MPKQTYKYGDEEFVITKPDGCAMQVTKGRYTAVISVHPATNLFRESLDGWGNDHASLHAALDSACRRMLDKSARPSKEELCSEMGKFYESLE